MEKVLPAAWSLPTAFDIHPCTMHRSLCVLRIRELAKAFFPDSLPGTKGSDMLCNTTYSYWLAIIKPNKTDSRFTSVHIWIPWIKEVEPIRHNLLLNTPHKLSNAVCKTRIILTSKRYTGLKIMAEIPLSSKHGCRHAYESIRNYKPLAYRKVSTASSSGTRFINTGLFQYFKPNQDSSYWMHYIWTVYDVIRRCKRLTHCYNPPVQLETEGNFIKVSEIINETQYN